MDGRERPCGGFSHLKTTQGLASAGSETFRADKSGSVAVTAAISLAAVLMVAGLAIDLGHWNSARTATVAAFDAAVLAGGRALQLGKSRDDAIALARKYYFENVQHRTSFLADSINFSVADNRLTLSAAGNVTLSTPFLGLTGRRAMALLKGTDLNRSTARIASGRYARENLEVALVLDTSAAMRGEKLINLKDAASDFVRLMVWDDQSQYRSRLALIPFASAVRPPEARLEAVRGQPPFHRHRAVALRIWNGILPFDRLRRRTPWPESLLRRRPWCGRSVPWRLHPDRNLCHGSRLDLKPFNGRQVTPVAGPRGPRSLRHVGRSPWLGLGLVCTVTELCPGLAAERGGPRCLRSRRHTQDCDLYDRQRFRHPIQ